MGRRLILVALLVVGCSGTAPTPQIVYVTAPPASQAPAPTPIVIYVTPAPTSTPTTAPTPAPSGIAGGAGAGFATAPALRTINGTLTYLGDTVHDIAKKHCQGRVAVGPGVQVTVRNETGTVIGIATLSDGMITSAGCVFTFKAASIPAATFYSFDIAGIPGQPVPAAKVIADGWTVALTMG